MKLLADTARKAALKASTLITSDIQNLAFDSGWNSEVASNTQVLFDGSSYHVSVPESLKGMAMDYEYGTTSSRPTAVLRKVGNRTEKLEEAIIKSIEKDLGLKL